MIYLKYLKYVWLHKKYVLEAGLKTGAPLRALLVHDWSKLLPGEFGHYARYFYGEKTPEAKQAFTVAWRLHIARNPHHYEYWVIDGIAQEIPECYIREMVADWFGAGRAIHGHWTEVASWYVQRGAVLAPNTRKLVEQLIAETTARFNGTTGDRNPEPDAG